MARVGGTLSVRGEFWGAARSSDLNATGRDFLRANTGVRYQRVWDLADGTQVSFEHESRLDHFVIDQDDAYDRQNTTSTHSSALTLRWPLMGRSKTGAHFVEPIYQIAAFGCQRTSQFPQKKAHMPNLIRQFTCPIPLSRT